MFRYHHEKDGEKTERGRNIPYTQSMSIVKLSSLSSSLSSSDELSKFGCFISKIFIPLRVQGMSNQME